MVLSGAFRKNLRYFAFLISMVMMTLVFFDSNFYRSFVKRQRNLREQRDVMDAFDNFVSPPSRAKQGRVMPGALLTKRCKGCAHPQNELFRDKHLLSARILKHISIGWDDFMAQRAKTDVNEQPRGILGHEQSANQESLPGVLSHMDYLGAPDGDLSANQEFYDSGTIVKRDYLINEPDDQYLLGDEYNDKVQTGLNDNNTHKQTYEFLHEQTTSLTGPDINTLININELSYANDDHISRIAAKDAKVSTMPSQRNDILSSQNILVDTDTTKPKAVEAVFNNLQGKVRTTVTLENGCILIKRLGTDFFTETKLKRNELDIMNLKPLEFDPRFKNPCWYGNSSSNSLFEDSRLHCLPYFYLLGVRKSGTTDLFSRMMTHHQLIRPGMKEPQWFPRLRFKTKETITEYGTVQMKALLASGHDNTNVTFYIGMYDRVAETIQRRSTMIDQPFSPWITGDATPANLHVNPIWEFLPGNENLSEPKYTNLNYIKHLNPNAKIVIIFRDPVTRLYSDFLHMSHRVRVEDRYVFHRHCAALTSAYTECLRSHTLRECVYNNSIVRNLQAGGIAIAESFLSSFYSVYMKDIYNLFDKSNVLPLLTSGYTSHTEDVLKRVFSFLDLDPIAHKEMNDALNMPIKNQSKRKGKSLGPMLPETADLLYQFFIPFNKQMAELMNDQRYMFEKSSS